MSWQSYVDQALISTNKIDQACIYGLENGEVWAASPGISLIDTEYDDLVKGFSDPTHLSANGLNINGVKYFILRADDRSIYGKKGNGGVINVKTNKAIIIGVYSEGVQLGEASGVVEKLADYLINLDYLI
ncbi:profilin [Cunninghamella echinulata]|nr:profilin [Cunninghamella echinulata]